MLREIRRGVLHAIAGLVVAGRHGRRRVKRVRTLAGECVVPTDLDVAQVAVFGRIFGDAVAQRGAALDLVEHFDRVAGLARPAAAISSRFEVRPSATECRARWGGGARGVDRDGDEARFAERRVVEDGNSRTPGSACQRVSSKVQARGAQLALDQRRRIELGRRHRIDVFVALTGPTDARHFAADDATERRATQLHVALCIPLQSATGKRPQAPASHAAVQRFPGFSRARRQRERAHADARP